MSYVKKLVENLISFLEFQKLVLNFLTAPWYGRTIPEL